MPVGISRRWLVLIVGGILLLIGTGAAIYRWKSEFLRHQALPIEFVGWTNYANERVALFSITNHCKFPIEFRVAVEIKKDGSWPRYASGAPLPHGVPLQVEQKAELKSRESYRLAIIPPRESANGWRVSILYFQSLHDRAVPEILEMGRIMADEKGFVKLAEKLTPLPKIMIACGPEMSSEKDVR